MVSQATSPVRRPLLRLRTRRSGKLVKSSMTKVSTDKHKAHSPSISSLLRLNGKPVRFRTDRVSILRANTTSGRMLRREETFRLSSSMKSQERESAQRSRKAHLPARRKKDW